MLRMAKTKKDTLRGWWRSTMGPRSVGSMKRLMALDSWATSTRNNRKWVEGLKIPQSAINNRQSKWMDSFRDLAQQLIKIRKSRPGKKIRGAKRGKKTEKG
jgi:hypothetical protein